MEALKSALKPLHPVTKSLPAPIKNLGVSLLGTKCYQTLVVNLDPTATECIKLAISKGLGIGIIGTASIVKVPQILKLINAKSAAGMSFLSIVLEISAQFIALAYNVRQGFPFGTYGETAFLVAQNVVIAVLVLQYSGKASAAAVLVAALAVAGVTLFSKDILSMQTMSYLQAGAGVLAVSSKLPQIVTIYQQGGTGQLSAFAVFNYLIGTLSRIYTTIQEVNDPLILYSFMAAFALNAILAAQMVYYWNAPSNKAKGKRRETPVAANKGKSTATPKGKSPTTRRRG